MPFPGRVVRRTAEELRQELPHVAHGLASGAEILGKQLADPGISVDAPVEAGGERLEWRGPKSREQGGPPPRRTLR